jgi:hypothetical protein
MRSQWCREHIDETAKNCGLGEDVVSDVKKAAKLCATIPDLSGCSTRSIMALIRIKDEDVRNHAISLAEKALKEETPTGGKKRDRLTEKEIKKIVDISFKEVRIDLTEKFKKEDQKPKKPGFVGCYQPGEVPVTDAPPQPSLAAQQAAKCPAGGCKDEDTCPAACHVNPGPAVMVNPVVINDTRRESPPIITDTTGKVSPVRDIPPNSRELKPSPFKTAAQVMAHDKDPLDIAGMFKDMDKAETVVKDTSTPQDPAKVLKEKRIQLSEDLLSCYSERFQMAARDHIRKETSWKNGAADFFYFGGEMLMDPPKSTVSSAGAAMRRS